MMAPIKKPSVQDFLKCESEKILEGKESDTHIRMPYVFAQALLFYGDGLFTDLGRKEAIEEYRSKISRLQRHVWENLKEEGDRISFCLDRSFHYGRLLRAINNRNYNDFYSVARAATTGFRPYYSYDEAKEMINAFGTPQLRQRIENMNIENGSFEELQEKMNGVNREIKSLAENIGSIRETINILQNFDMFVSVVTLFLPYYQLDPSLIKGI